ncbi:MAG: septum formation protein Maf, partial [Deltaproteobacteria bacterium]|nr:septum formation protein Maf [Deltaproteobacteria bacterium]
DLLTQVGLPFETKISHMDEEKSYGDPEQTACLLAEKKARDVLYHRVGKSWVLGADTVVVVDSATSEIPARQNGTIIRILGKPKDAKEAIHMLRLLSGKEHRVITGFCILDPSGKTAHLEAVITRVHIKKLSDQEIDAYVNTHEPFGKAGSYAIQGIGAFMVKSISGSYTNVVGLPLYALTKALVAVRALKGFPLPQD